MEQAFPWQQRPKVLLRRLYGEMSSRGMGDSILIKTAHSANLQPGPRPSGLASKHSLPLPVPAAHCGFSLWPRALTHPWSHKSWLPRGVLGPSFRQGRRPCPPTQDPKFGFFQGFPVNHEWLPAPLDHFLFQHRACFHPRSWPQQQPCS